MAKAKKMTDKQKMMEMKTSSKIPKTPREKKMWERARQLTAKQTGRYSEKEIPWGEVVHVYKNEKKAGKVMKKSDITKAKKEPSVSSYKTERSAARKAATADAIKTFEKRKKDGSIRVKSSKRS